MLKIEKQLICLRRSENERTLLVLTCDDPSDAFFYMSRFNIIQVLQITLMNDEYLSTKVISKPELEAMEMKRQADTPKPSKQIIDTSSLLEDLL